MAERLIITNASAGSSDQDAIDAAVAVLQTAGPVRVERCEGAEGLLQILSSRAAGAGPVVAMGGDGSLHTLVNALHRRGELDSTVVGLIPMGTGNDYARTVGLSLDPVEAARQHLEGVVRKLDVVMDDRNTVIVNAVHVGIGADAAREARSWKKRLGKVGYVVGAVKAGLSSPGLRLRIWVDRREVRGRGTVLQLVVGNGAYVGGGTEVAPGARPADGLVDVGISYADSPLARLGYGLRLRRGTHPQRDDVVAVRGSSVSTRGQAFWCNADGELSGPYRSASWRVRPAALAMVLPSGQPGDVGDAASEPAASDGLGPELEP